MSTTNTIYGLQYTEQDIAAIGQAIDNYVLTGTRDQTAVVTKTRELFTARKHMYNEIYRLSNNQILFSKSSTYLAKNSNDTVGVKLSSKPSTNVVINITSTNTGITISPTSLTFTPTNWDTEQTATLTTGGTTHGVTTVLFKTTNTGGYDGVEKVFPVGLPES